MTSSISSEQSLPPLDVPKELWRLVDFIFMNGLDEVSFFLTFSAVFIDSSAIICFVKLLFITGPPNEPVLFCSLASVVVVCHRRL